MYVERRSPTAPAVSVEESRSEDHHHQLSRAACPWGEDARRRQRGRDSTERVREIVAELLVPYTEEDRRAAEAVLAKLSQLI